MSLRKSMIAIAFLSLVILGGTRILNRRSRFYQTRAAQYAKIELYSKRLARLSRFTPKQARALKTAAIAGSCKSEYEQAARYPWISVAHSQPKTMKLDETMRTLFGAEYVDRAPGW